MAVNYKVIPGYDRYMVGDDGTVWRVWGEGKWKKLKTESKKVRYPIVTLSKNNEVKSFHIHYLVLMAFVGPRPAGMEARHYPDNDPHNNKLSNLSWSSKKINQRDRVEHGTHNRGENCIHAKLTEEDVLEIRSLWRSNKWTLKRIASLYGVSLPCVGLIVTYRNWKHLP
jgi:hypothetical protein